MSGADISHQQRKRFSNGLRVVPVLTVIIEENLDQFWGRAPMETNMFRHHMTWIDHADDVFVSAEFHRTRTCTVARLPASQATMSGVHLSELVE